MFLGQKILGCAAWSVDVELLFGKLRSTDRAPHDFMDRSQFFFVSKVSPTYCWPWWFGVYVRDEILPSYVGITINQLYGSLLNNQDSMESKAGIFERGWTTW